MFGFMAETTAATKLVKGGEPLPMPFMRYELSAANLRAMRDAGTHSVGDHTHRQALQLRQNVAPKIHAIQRPIIPPRCNGLALL